MPDLKAVYRAETAEGAAARLDEFEARWGQRYPAVVPAWRRAWEHVVPMFTFPPAIRKMIYTTNAMESLRRLVAGKTSPGLHDLSRSIALSALFRVSACQISCSIDLASA